MLEGNTIAEPTNQLEYIEDSRRQHGYSAGIQDLFDMAVDYIPWADEQARLGKKAVWTQGVFEAPLFYACDTIPVSAIDLGRLSSGRSVEIAEESFDLPKETCSMISVLLGEWVRKGYPHLKRIAAFNNACEPFNMAYELIASHGYDIHRVESAVRPKHADEAASEGLVNFLALELQDLAIWLTGKPVDETRMLQELERANRVQERMRRIVALRLKNPLYVKSLPMVFLLMGMGHYFGRPERFEAVQEQVIAELERAAYVEPRGHREIIPLTWLGARGLEFGVYKAVDDAGGALLSWYTPNPYDKVWRTDISPLESMARFILDYFLSTSPVRQIQGIERLVQSSGSRGIFFYTYVGCAFGGVHVEIFREYFQKMGLPSIGLDGSFQVGVPSGQLLTRVRAFVEMLQKK